MSGKVTVNQSSSIDEVDEHLIFHLDENGYIKSWNKGSEKVSGYTAKEVLDKHFRFFYTVEDQNLRLPELLLEEAAKTGKSIHEGLRMDKDMKPFRVSEIITALHDHSNHVIGFVKIIRTLSEGKRNDQETIDKNLKLSLKEVSDYKYALDESSIVAITDQKGIINYANNNFCKISKYSKDELIGQDHRIVNSGYHTKEFIRNLWTTIANGKIWKGELKNKAKDGTIYWVDTTIVPFLNEQGKPYQYVAIRADITQRKQTEEKLAQSEKIYKTIASSIPGTVITLFDHDYRFLLIEGDALEKAGYKKEKLLGNKAHDVLTPERFAHIKNAYERVFKGESFSIETPRGDYDFISHFVPFKNERNEVYLAMSVAIDVTELKKAHRAISELNVGLEQKIVKRTMELELANKELEAFSYSVAHDLRTPLRAVAGYSTMLTEDYGSQFDEEGQRLLGELQYNNKKMAKLIDDLLTFSRLGRKPINKSLVNMNELITSVLTDISTFNAKIITGELHPIIADASLMKNVMINLLSNAAKYSSKTKNAIIEIFSDRKDNGIVYSVRDNGVGFDMAYSKKLFGVFQRLHSDEEFDGTGVGLAIVQRIVHRHGGVVWALAKINEGATFSFSIPNEQHTLTDVENK